MTTQLSVAFEEEVVDMWRLAVTLATIDPVLLNPHRKALIEIREYIDTIMMKQGIAA